MRQTGRRVSLAGDDGSELASGWVVSVAPGEEQVTLFTRSGWTVAWPEYGREPARDPWPPPRWLRLAGIALLSALGAFLATFAWMLEVSS